MSVALPPSPHLLTSSLEVVCLVFQVIIGSPDLKANHSITQHVTVMAESDKYPALMKLLAKEMDGRRILIFCETKRGCDDVGVQGFPGLAL